MEELTLEDAYGSRLARDRLSLNCRKSLIRNLTAPEKLTRRKRLDSDATVAAVTTSTNTVATGDGEPPNRGINQPTTMPPITPVQEGKTASESKTPKEIGDKYISTIDEAAAAGLCDF